MAPDRALPIRTPAETTTLRRVSQNAGSETFAESQSEGSRVLV